MDYDAFKREVRRNFARPAIVNVNVGTTVRGAVDDLDRILDILQEAGYSEDRFYIHCDGALFGLMVGRLFAAAKIPLPLDTCRRQNATGCTAAVNVCARLSVTSSAWKHSVSLSALCTALSTTASQALSLCLQQPDTCSQQPSSDTQDG